MHAHPEPTASADELIALFFESTDNAGQFTSIAADRLPVDYRRLLDHHKHMTVTIEAFHDSLVDVQVLDVKKTDQHYARKILLTRQCDGAVVQFGIVRFNRQLLPAAALSEIESQRTPLGRVLIEQGVLRQVELLGLWQIMPSSELSRLLNCDPSQITYGRSAMIHVHDKPAVELLEIVAPVDP